MVVTQPAGFLKVLNNCATNSSVLSRAYSFFKSSWSRCGQRLSLWFGIDDNTFIFVRSSSDLIWFRWDFNNGLLTGKGCVDAGRNNKGLAKPVKGRCKSCCQTWTSSWVCESVTSSKDVCEYGNFVVKQILFLIGWQFAVLRQKSCPSVLLKSLVKACRR